MGLRPGRQEEVGVVMRSPSKGNSICQGAAV